MKELTRTDDRVFLSWLLARLAADGIEPFVFDSHTSSAFPGVLDAIPSRVMVADADHWRAKLILEQAGADRQGASRKVNIALSKDALLGGKVAFSQPRKGYRIAIDPVLLAAAVPAGAADTVLDAGSGAGAAALCLAARVPGVRVRGIEIEAELVRLARQNAEENGFADRVAFSPGDILDPPADFSPESFDHVIANPPHLKAGRSNPPPDPAKALANIEGAAGLGHWIDFCLHMARPGGSVTLIHRADRLDELLERLAGRPAGAGGIVVFPLWPGGAAKPAEPAKPAKRVIVRGLKGSAAPLRQSPGLVLHRPDGAYTAAAEAVLREGKALRM